LTIVGTGAVGCIYGWRISQNAAVTTVCRSNYDVVRRDGFAIQSKKWGQGTFRPHSGMLWFQFAVQITPLFLIRIFNPVIKNTNEAAKDEFDYVIVTMKSLPDIVDVSEIIRPG
jgi:2-dehydropantoate 2-reductase